MLFLLGNCRSTPLFLPTQGPITFFMGPEMHARVRPKTLTAQAQRRHKCKCQNLVVYCKMVALWALPGRALISWPVGAVLAGVSAIYLEHPAHLVSKTTAGKLHLLLIIGCCFMALKHASR